MFATHFKHLARNSFAAISEVGNCRQLTCHEPAVRSLRISSYSSFFSSIPILNRSRGSYGVLKRLQYQTCTLTIYCLIATNKRKIFQKKNIIKQECIPVGCIPPVAVLGGLLVWWPSGVVPSGVVAFCYGLLPPKTIPDGHLQSEGHQTRRP